MKPIAFLFLFTATLCACNSGENADSAVNQESCQAIREHMADLRLAGVQINIADKAKAVAELAKHKMNLSGSGGQKAIEQCIAHRSPQWIQCALDAKSLADVSKCE